MHPKPLERLVRRALREDIGPADITTEATIEPGARCRVTLRAKSEGVLSGTAPFKAAFELLQADLREFDCKADGAPYADGDTVASFEGSTGPVLTAERTALNFLQHLSGVASLTARYVAAVKGLSTRICDTRKTTPGLRELEKEAVRHGGGHNHRHALYDGILIKENHIAAAGGIAKSLDRVRNSTHHLMNPEIEVRTPDECREALNAGARAVLLDNMPLDAMRECVAMDATGFVVFEASGNVSLENVRAVAETGVHVISVGALTHSAPAADLSLLIEHL